MTRWRKQSRIATALLASVALALGPAAATAIAAPGNSEPGIQAPGTEPPLTDRAPRFLELSVDSVSPSSVTTTSDPTVSVSATVTNVGDRPVDDINVRMQRAAAVATSAELRTSLRLDQYNFDIVGDFVTVADRLGAGQKKTFTLTMPLRAVQPGPDAAPNLGISQPGIYPFLLNVNGAPEFGDEARLDDARFLLPVLGVPPDPTAPDPAADDARAVAPSTATPVATTLLWPLADRPRLVAGIPGSLDQRVRLVDDDLATSLRKDGRLGQLVSALEFATGPSADDARRLRDSTCIAVDPDLLITVSNMARGYLVLENPDDPTGPTRDGTGAAVAAEWLEQLRTIAAEMCTLAMPFAQVDVPAVAALNDSEITASAITAPSDIVDGILGATSVRGVTWPDAGTIDDDTGMFVRSLGTTTVVVAGNAVDGNTEDVTAQPDLVRIPTAVPPSAPANPPDAPANTEPLHAATFDISAATALAAVGAQPQTPSFTPAKARYDLEDDSREARLQDALGAISWSALTPQPNRPRSMLLVPPQQWTADGNEAAAILSAVTTLLRSGLATPRSFTDLLGRPADLRPFALIYPQQAVDDAVPESIRSSAGSQAASVTALLGALVEDPQSELTPRLFGAPLREDLLRAMSLSGRRDDGRSAAEAAAQARLSQSRQSVDAMFRSVTVLSPGGVYTLASEQSPLLLVARNDLPVGIRVRLRIDAPPEMKITDIGEQQLPPRGSRPLQVPAEVSDTRNLFVDVALTTPGGHDLGEPTTVSVRSNAYGQALAIITGCAGALLLLLAGRRLLHRFRGQPDPADEGFERS